MECRTKNVVAPSGKEITAVHDDSSRLKNARLSWAFTQMKNETYYRLCRLKVLCVRILYLETTDIILKEESEGAIIYSSPCHEYFPLSRSEMQHTRMCSGARLALLQQRCLHRGIR